MNNNFKFILATILIIFGISGRLIIETPNVETVMAASIIAGALLGPYWGVFVGLTAVVGSDMILGNTNILWYTWSAWALIGILAAFAKLNPNKSVWSSALKLTGAGVIGTALFYIWTNFGVWHLSGMYAHTWSGLVQSYIMGLPFLRNQLLGNLLIVPVASVITLTILKYIPAIITYTRGIITAQNQKSLVK